MASGQGNGTERMLGKLSSQIDSLDNRVNRLEQDISKARSKRDQEMKDLKRDLYSIKEDMIASQNYAKGGRKMLVALVAAAGALGGGLWELARHLLPVLK